MKTRRDNSPLPAAGPKASPRAFTLIEIMVVMLIIATLLSMGSLAFSRISRGNILAQARNTVITYAKVARSYAIANRIETMMVVNPFNGRFELWRLNPPEQGGPFDPLSSIAPDGYAFAPVFDTGARLPLDAKGVPVAMVHPIDYDDLVDPTNPGGPVYRPTNNDVEGRNIDNLTWAAFCFDENGRLVVRTRRIATRTYHHRDGTLRTTADRNRLPDETPDVSISPLVKGFPPAGADGPTFDTAITSARGFVITETHPLSLIAPTFNEAPDALVNALIKTRPGGQLASHSTTVLLNRSTGQELIGGAP